MRRWALTLWIMSALLWVGFAAAMPRVGEAALRRAHFADPNPGRRARALVVRALHRWELAGTEGRADQRQLLESAQRDLTEADRLGPLPDALVDLRDECADSARALSSGP